MHPSVPAQPDFSATSVADRLLAEFAERLDSRTICRTVEACVTDISAVPVPALAELVERAARQRLLVLCDPGATLVRAR